MTKQAKKSVNSKKINETKEKLNNSTALTNVPNYSIETAIHEILLGTELTGRAESGFIVAIFNDDQFQASQDKKTKTWNYPVLNYWNAPERNTDKNGKKIDGMPPTRKEHASAFLMRFEEYAAVNKKLSDDTAALKKAAKDKAPVAQATAEHAVAEHTKKLNAAHSMFSRAMSSVYLLRSKDMNVAKVSLGESNQVIVETADGKVEQFKSSALRDRGVELLRKDGKMAEAVSRNTNKKTATTGTNGTVNAIPVVNAVTARTVLQSFDKLIEQDAFVPPLNSDAQGTVLNKNDMAETMLRMVRKFTAVDASNNPEFRGTVSQIIVSLTSVLGIKTLKDAQALAMRSVNKEVA